MSPSGSRTQTSGTDAVARPFCRRASRSRFSGVNADGAAWRLLVRIGAVAAARGARTSGGSLIPSSSLRPTVAPAIVRSPMQASQRQQGFLVADSRRRGPLPSLRVRRSSRSGSGGLAGALAAHGRAKDKANTAASRARALVSPISTLAPRAVLGSALSISRAFLAKRMPPTTTMTMPSRLNVSPS